MRKPMAGPTVGLVLLALLAVRLISGSGGASDKHLTVTFGSTSSLYAGAAVKVLGVKVGTVEDIEVVGTAVKVKLAYSRDVDLPPDVGAMIVPPSIVGDRFVQLAPAYRDGPALPDKAEIGLDRTAVPVELGDTFKSINSLVEALGPDGANKDGALSRLLDTAAKTFKGRGQQTNAALRSLADALGTLADASPDAEATVEKLRRVTGTLAGSDSEIRTLVTLLAEVGQLLNGQGPDLTKAVRGLNSTLHDVASFTGANKQRVGELISSLSQVTGQFADHSDQIAEILDVVPLGLTNLTDIYVPNNFDLKDFAKVPATARQGSLALRADLFEDLDVQLGAVMNSLCTQLPPQARQELSAFCTALVSVGAGLGNLLSLLGRQPALLPSGTGGATSLADLMNGVHR